MWEIPRNFLKGLKKRGEKEGGLVPSNYKTNCCN